MKYSKHLIAFFIALLFSWLFFERSGGINLFIFDAALVSAIYFLQREKLQSINVKIFLAGTILSALFVVVHHSAWSILMHHISVFLLGGALAAPALKSVVSTFVAAVANVVLSVREYIVSRMPRPKIQGKPAYKFLYAVRLSIIPILLVLLFGWLYSSASPWFNQFWGNFTTFLAETFGEFFNMISWTWFFTLVFGLLITVYLLFAKSAPAITTIEDDQPDDLAARPDEAKNPEKIKREHQMALAIFGSLNLLLLGQNALDLTHVWFGFDWNGEFLKQFVHEGTWLLIISILLSAGILLYFFRSDLNFMKNNKTLRPLANIFIFQNMFLAASVAVRNIWYIDYFNLAFKRIGVFFFLAAVLYGLFTIFIKVGKQKTIYFLLRKNSLAVYLLLLTIGFVNWDSTIARYNFAHADKAYVHLSFLSELSDKALPDLLQPIEKLERVKQNQDEKYGRDKYALTPEDYQERIAHRIEDFKEDYESRHWLEWTYAEWRAYKKLKALEENKNSITDS